MTIEEQIRDKNTKEFAEFLFNFFIGFHNENIKGLCDDTSYMCYEKSCAGCIEKWLQTIQPLTINK